MKFVSCVVAGVAVTIGLSWWLSSQPRATRCSSEAVVVTGTSSGLGGALKQKLESEGYTVIGASRKEGIDLRSAASILKLRERAAASGLPLVGLVNNAGTFTFPEGTKYSERDFVDELSNGEAYREYVADEAINVRALINVTGVMLPLLIAGAEKCGSSTIVNVGSINGVLNLIDSLPYGATKGAIEMWTDSLRRTLIAKKIRVTALQPLFIKSSMCDFDACQEPNITCVPAVFRALTSAYPSSRYTCAMQSRSHTLLSWHILFWLQKHAPAWLTDCLVPPFLNFDE